MNYASNALAAAVSQVSPSWTGEKTLGVTLYCGASTDGVDRPFQPGSVHLAFIGIGIGIGIGGGIGGEAPGAHC